MAKKDYYEILGVSKHSSKEEIKKAYRDLCKIHHPDKGGNEERFKEISEAYENLSDTEKRAKYDQFGHEFQGQRSDFAYDFNFRGQAQRRVGQNMVLNVKLSLEEIFNGVKKQYKYHRNDKCGNCDGYGDTEHKECNQCKGSGVVMHVFKTPIGLIRQAMSCNTCSGLGFVVENECKTCSGSGLNSKEETIEVDIPRGVKNGMVFVMENKGHAVKGGECGDLHINIVETNHEVFTRINNDLRLTLNLSYPQLVLGDKVEIDTIEGGRIRVTIPPHTDVGTNLKIVSKGLYGFNEDKRGDLIINVGVVIPKTITDTQKELLERLKNLN